MNITHQSFFRSPESVIAERERNFRLYEPLREQVLTPYYPLKDKHLIRFFARRHHSRCAKEQGLVDLQEAQDMHRQQQSLQDLRRLHGLLDQAALEEIKQQQQKLLAQNSQTHNTSSSITSKVPKQVFNNRQNEFRIKKIYNIATQDFNTNKRKHSLWALQNPQATVKKSNYLSHKSHTKANTPQGAEQEKKEVNKMTSPNSKNIKKNKLEMQNTKQDLKIALKVYKQKIGKESSNPANFITSEDLDHILTRLEQVQ